MGVGTLNELVCVGYKKNAANEQESLDTAVASLHALKNENNSYAIDHIIKEFYAMNNKPGEKTFTTSMKHAWQHTREVYIPTYVVDWIVWPPLQLVNFTFVPLKYQVLYVNTCNLLWNTFLSFMANKGH